MCDQFYLLLFDNLYFIICVCVCVCVCVRGGMRVWGLGGGGGRRARLKKHNPTEYTLYGKEEKERSIPCYNSFIKQSRHVTCMQMKKSNIPKLCLAPSLPPNFKGSEFCTLWKRSSVEHGVSLVMKPRHFTNVVVNQQKQTPRFHYEATWAFSFWQNKVMRKTLQNEVVK